MKDATPQPDNAQIERRGGRRIAWIALLLAIIIGVILWFPPEETIAPPEIDTEFPETVPVEQPEPPALPNRPLTNDLQSFNTTPAIPLSDTDKEITIFGRVLLDGVPPKDEHSRKLRLKSGCLGPESPEYVVAADGGLANVFVFVESGLEGRKFIAPTQPYIAEALNCFLHPFVFGVQINQPVLIRNHQRHHPFKVVSSTGSEFAWERGADGRMEDELKIIFSGEDVFSKLVCRVHPWNWGYAGVVPHPFFTVTDTNGIFRLPKGLLPGSYKITAAHPRSGKISETVNAITGGKHQVFFKLKPRQESVPETEPAPESEEIEFSSSPEAAFQDSSPTVSSGFAADEQLPESNKSVIRGTIKLIGTPPPERQMTDVRGSRDCAPLQTNLPVTQFYRVSADGGLADAIIFITQGLPDRKYQPSQTPVIIDQVRCQYTPQIVALQTGQKLLVRNSDPIMHNVHPTPVTPGNKEYNKAQMPKAPDLEFIFNQPEKFLKIRCDVHPWMFAFPFIVDHPFFAVSDTAGNFTITNVPPGTYTLEAVHRKAGSLTKEITVGDGKALEFIFELK